MEMSRRQIILAFAARAWAQEAPTFSADVKVVSLLATVQDKDGRVVKNLTQDDFVLQEDGVTQTIKYYSRESDLPLTIGLLVDTSRSQTGVLEKERRASYTFLDKVLREDKDLAFVTSFDRRVEILQGLTSSRKELASALGQLQIPGEFATLIFSAVRESSERVMRKQPGRKAFILLTDGVAFRDDTSIVTAIEFAQRADTLIYSIRFSDPIHVYMPVRAAALKTASERGKHGLERMSSETGGAMYEVGKNGTIEEIYAQIEDALRHQYSIGYTPERKGEGAGYHKVKLNVKQRGLVVRTREGYYAQ